MEGLALGGAIRPRDFYKPVTRSYEVRDSCLSLRERAEASGVIISIGPWGPRGGVRWQYNAVATDALSTTDRENLQELILANYPERKIDRHRDILRACLSNPNTSAAFLMKFDLSGDADTDLRCALVGNPAIPIATVEEMPIPHPIDDVPLYAAIVERLARDGGSTEHLLRFGFQCGLFYPASAPSPSTADPVWTTLFARGQAGDLKAAMGIKLMESGAFRETNQKEFFDALAAMCDE